LTSLATKGQAFRFFRFKIVKQNNKFEKIKELLKKAEQAASGDQVKNEAIGLYKKVLTLNPSNFDAAYNLARVFQTLGKTKDSFKYFNLAIKINLSSKNAYLGLAYTLVSLGRVENALEAYEKVRLFDPFDANIIQEMAALFTRINNCESAIV